MRIKKFLLNGREIAIALISTCGAIAVYAATQGSPPAIMGSSAFDWNAMEAKPTEVGSVRKVCQAPTATLDELECHITTLNPGQSSHPPHQHPNEEIVIIREGTVEVLVNGELKRVGPGSVVFNASNVLHSLRNVGDAPAVYHVLNWRSPTSGPKPAANSAK